MDVSEALRTVHFLADGVNPVAGEVFPADSPYQHPSVIRSLYEGVKALERTEERQRRGDRLPRKAGKPWRDGEDQETGFAPAC